MSENIREDCKWLEVIQKYYDEPSKFLCHLTSRSKRVDPCKDCANCKSYVKNEEKNT